MCAVHLLVVNPLVLTVTPNLAGSLADALTPSHPILPRLSPTLSPHLAASLADTLTPSCRVSRRRSHPISFHLTASLANALTPSHPISPRLSPTLLPHLAASLASSVAAVRLRIYEAISCDSVSYSLVASGIARKFRVIFASTV